MHRLVDHAHRAPAQLLLDVEAAEVGQRHRLRSRRRCRRRSSLCGGRNVLGGWGPRRGFGREVGGIHELFRLLAGRLLVGQPVQRLEGQLGLGAAQLGHAAPGHLVEHFGDRRQQAAVERGRQAGAELGRHAGRQVVEVGVDQAQRAGQAQHLARQLHHQAVFLGGLQGVGGTAVELGDGLHRPAQGLDQGLGDEPGGLQLSQLDRARALAAPGGPAGGGGVAHDLDRLLRAAGILGGVGDQAGGVQDPGRGVDAAVRFQTAQAAGGGGMVEEVGGQAPADAGGGVLLGPAIGLQEHRDLFGRAMGGGHQLLPIACQRGQVARHEPALRPPGHAVRARHGQSASGGIAVVVERRRMNGRLSTGDGVPGRKRSTTSAAVSRARIAGCSSRSTIRNPPSVLDAPSC